MSKSYLSSGLLIASLTIVSSLSAADKPADLIIVNGNVVTVDGKSSIAEAAAIRDGVFIAVGRNDDIRKLAGDVTRVVDAKGRTVIPGLMETHVHATGVVRGDLEIPFVQLRSIDEVKDWVRRRAGETPAGEWIRLPRVDVTRIRERRLPTRKDLDEAAPQHPAVYVWQYANRQIQVLNAQAIKACGNHQRHQASCRVGRFIWTKRATPPGSWMTAVRSPRDSCRRRKSPKRTTSIASNRCSGDITNWGSPAFSSAARTSPPSGRIRSLRRKIACRRCATVTIMLPTDGTVEGTEKAIRELPIKPAEGDDWVRVGPLKVSVDGGVLYGTAFMRTPYGSDAFSLYGISDPAYRGLLQRQPETVKNIIRTGHRMGWQMSTHVTGDAAVDSVLDAVEAANADSPIKERRFTLIHAYFPNPETAQRAARLGVCVDTQPIMYYIDGDALTDALGQHRIRNFMGVKAWQTAGVKVAINADHMQGFGPRSSLNPYDPFLAMSTAITRKTESGAVIGPEQRVSREDALRTMTIDAAWLSFDEKRKGSIEVGKLADLAILSADFLTCEEEKIKDIRSDVTIVGGKVVYVAERDRNGSE